MRKVPQNPVYPPLPENIPWSELPTEARDFDARLDAALAARTGPFDLKEFEREFSSIRDRMSLHQIYSFWFHVGAPGKAERHELKMLRFYHTTIAWSVVRYASLSSFEVGVPNALPPGWAALPLEKLMEGHNLTIIRSGDNPQELHEYPALGVRVVTTKYSAIPVQWEPI